ncbi:hypothetical protein [Gracilibacillus kekensis]|uniref:Uncharacterized protein n=1 Tax=Gracilibacillus kekensis TaxID=1027249 RepID=A0A1M7QG21_9BACI|nr:hypothetical protein [Gracilibacillus kekensis]SHN29944.1 hypothetical protein SAMN05216179_3119 [Gracilibacillus kekensis]
MRNQYTEEGGVIFVDTEKNQWKLTEVNHLGLKKTQGLVTIGSRILEHLLANKHKPLSNQLDEYIASKPKLEWDDDFPYTHSVFFKAAPPDDEKINKVLSLYGKNKFENLSPDQASKYVDMFKPNTPEHETRGIHLHILKIGSNIIPNRSILVW